MQLLHKEDLCEVQIFIQARNLQALVNQACSLVNLLHAVISWQLYLLYNYLF